MEERKERKGDLRAMTVKATEIGFATYDHVLFVDLTLNIRKNEVTAVTGKSGSGKTVLLKILSGQEHQQDGTVTIPPGVRISFVPQELGDIEVDKETSIRQLFKDARGLTELEVQLTKYEQLMSTNPDEKTLSEYGDILEKYQEMDGYNPEPEMEKILSGLGIDKESTGHITLDTKLSEVSSGQLRKVMIAKALYSKPDLLLLDDPTSHLDVSSVKWLSGYLKGASSAVVVSSNNQEFIDSCANQTVGLTDIGRTFVFDGGYSDFVIKRDAIIEAEKTEADSVATKLDQLNETDKMFRSRQVYRRSANMAQVGRALETRISRLQQKYNDLPGSKDVYREEKVRDLSFTQERRSGQNVVSINRIVKKYGDFIALDFKDKQPLNIQHGERWLFWGQNGSGKSTLSRMIVHQATGGEFLPTEGAINIGSNIDVGYFSPDTTDVSKSGSLINEVTTKMNINNKGRATSVLRFFGFSNTAIYNQDVKTLSSGEKKRVTLAKIMLRNPNLLVLDEPAGDYMPDEIKQRLASALEKFDGTLIIVSHDLGFIEQIKFNRRLLFPEGRVQISS